MNMVAVDFNQVVGKVKPMHAVNNGPSKRPPADEPCYRSNFYTFKEAGIPYARNHDASFCTSYGGYHSVDVHVLFPNFDADVNDPASYDFELTDQYCRRIEDAGCKTFYRLGAKIEHESRKYGTLMPRDFQKWAEICEHIIRHYTEGWADGFHFDIEYWEIWNEPDLDLDDAENKRTWSGTAAQFRDFYEVAAKHLKKCFPNFKIGGPAIAHREEWADAFLQEMSARNVPLDFFSWHTYTDDPAWIFNRVEHWRAALDKYGYTKTENICNEWNYVKNWTDKLLYSQAEVIHGMKGAAFTAAIMLGSQQRALDMLMYYDARIQTQWNGLFDFYTLRPLKGYYPFKMFNALYTLGTSVKAQAEGDGIHVAAAKNDNGETAVMFVHYTDDDTEIGEKTVLVHVANGADVYTVCLLDETHSEEMIGTVKNGETITVKPNSVVLLKSV